MSAEDADGRREKMSGRRGGRVVALRRREGRPARWADAHAPLLAICLALTRNGFIGEKSIRAFGWVSRYLRGWGDASGACQKNEIGERHSAREMESARALDACPYALPRRRHPVRERHAFRRLGGRPIAIAHRDRGCTDPTRLLLTAPIRLKKLTAPKNAEDDCRIKC